LAKVDSRLKVNAAAAVTMVTFLISHQSSRLLVYYSSELSGLLHAGDGDGNVECSVCLALK